MPEKPTYEELEQRIRELEKANFERKQSGKTLLGNRRLLEDLMENSGTIIVIKDNEGKNQWVNNKWEEVTGLNREFVLGKTDEMLFPAETASQFRKNDLHVLETGSVVETEELLNTPSGMRYFISNKFPLYDDDGKITGLCGIITDITERKEAEHQIQQSASLLNTTQQLAKIGGWEMDLKKQITFWTDEVYRIHDLKPDRFTSMDKEEAFQSHDHQPDEFTSIDEAVKLSMECYDPDDRQVIIDAFRKCTDEGQPYDLEFPFTTTKGRRIWIRTITKPVFEDGKIIKVVGYFMDITERKQLEEQLRQTQKMESIGNLAGGIAHDFNNLLSPIIGMSEMLLEDLSPDSLEYENALEILNAGKRAGDLVDQILAFSRQSEHKMTPVRMQNILKEVLKLSRSTIPTNIEIHEKIQPNCGLVMADSTQMHQVAMNLITNAFHAVEEKNGIINIELKEITLRNNELPDSLLQPGQYVRLSVSDSGIGMVQDIINNIFDPYFTTKEKGKGTGLGLAVVYGIVKDHKGDIKVHSEIGKGTTFHIYFPLMKKTAKTVSIDQISGLETGTENLLIVDDEESVVRFTQQMLERLGYQVTAKTSSVDALNLFKANPDSFDLVISDMAMPDMTGDELAKKIFSIKEDIPFIICTGFSERINNEQAKELGVKRFIMKPILKSEMAQIVRKVLDEAKNSNK